MSSFTSPLIVRDNGDDTWTLASRFRYRVGSLDSGEVIDVPGGFTTDYASVPRAFWAVCSPHGRHGKAAVVHDYLYSTGGYFGRYSRKTCDLIFLEAMKVLGVPGWRALLMHRAVRLFGGRHFKSFDE